MADLNVGGAGSYADWAGQRPKFWNPERAVTFLQALVCIEFYLEEHVPITPEMVAMIFFHETSFSDARQLVRNSKGVDVPQGAGIGFGQIEVKNDDKPAFFKAVFEDPYSDRPYDPDGMIDDMLKDEQFAIKVHCEYLKYLHHKPDGPKDTKGILMGQFGARNSALVDVFLPAEASLRAALYQGNKSRKDVIQALNDCRFNVKPDGCPGLENTSAPFDRFRRYWDWTLPEEDLKAIRNLWA